MPASECLSESERLVNNRLFLPPRPSHHSATVHLVPSLARLLHRYTASPEMSVIVLKPVTRPILDFLFYYYYWFEQLTFKSFFLN